jgi:hypothetical protein
MCLSETESCRSFISISSRLAWLKRDSGQRPKERTDHIVILL